MEEGTFYTGKLVGFTYVGREVSYCRISVNIDGSVHTAIIGLASLYTFRDMLSLKGAGASITAKYVGDNEYGASFEDTEFDLS